MHQVLEGRLASEGVVQDLLEHSKRVDVVQHRLTRGFATGLPVLFERLPSSFLGGVIALKKACTAVYINICQNMLRLHLIRHHLVDDISFFSFGAKTTGEARSSGQKRRSAAKWLLPSVNTDGTAE